MAMKWVERLKNKWGINSNLNFVLIMIVFSLAGLMISFSRPVIFHLFGIRETTHLWIKILGYAPLILIYQVFLLIFGTLLGQFGFFWEKEKKIGKFLVRSLSQAVLRRT